MREAARWRRAKAEEFASDNIARHRSNRAMVAIQIAAKFVEQLPMTIVTYGGSVTWMWTVGD